MSDSQDNSENEPLMPHTTGDQYVSINISDNPTLDTTDDWEYNQDSLPACRICLEEESPANMLQPCRCTGYSKFVHVSCLDEWRATSNNPEAFNRCFTCNYTYRTEVSERKLGLCGSLNFGQPRYYCGFYVMNFVAILLIGIVLQLIDPNHLIPKFFSHYLNPIHFLDANPHLQTNGTVTPAPTQHQHHDPQLQMFDYYILSSYIYFLLLLIIFSINILRIKNRMLYVKYLVGGPCHIAVIRIIFMVGLTILCLTTSTIIGCFFMTCLIQVIARHHYNYLNHLYRASESRILSYDRSKDTELDIEN
jgi:hypothetical protein